MTTTAIPNLSGFVEHLGIPISPIGDDGEILLALGHHDPLKAAHAFDRFLRRTIGDRSGLSYMGTPVEVAQDIHEMWAVTVTECGDCGSKPDCRQCTEMKSADWWIDWTVSGTDEGAFPVMVLHLEG